MLGECFGSLASNNDANLNDDSDKMDITKNENEEESTNENINDEEWKEIFNNSILLDKIMQQWREALNQQAELIAQHSQVRIQKLLCGRTVVERNISILINLLTTQFIKFSNKG